MRTLTLLLLLANSTPVWAQTAILPQAGERAVQQPLAPERPDAVLVSPQAQPALQPIDPFDLAQKCRLGDAEACAAVSSAPNQPGVNLTGINPTGQINPQPVPVVGQFRTLDTPAVAVQGTLPGVQVR